MSKDVFETLLTKHRTVCTGYAYLVRELARHAGIPCEIVNGYGRTAEANVGGEGVPNHSWNAVQLHNRWYLCDATWSSGAIDPGKAAFVKKYNDSYFLPDPSLFIRNHYPVDTAWMLVDDKPALETFLNRPLVYSAIFPHKIDQLFPDTFTITASKGETVSFRFAQKSRHPIEKVELNVGERNSSIHPPLYIDAGGLYCIDHTFAMKGTHIVHILLDGQYAATYTLKVR